MRCSTCQGPIEETATVCGSCGTPVSALETSMPVPADEPPPLDVDQLEIPDEEIPDEEIPDGEISDVVTQEPVDIGKPLAAKEPAGDFGWPEAVVEHQTKEHRLRWPIPSIIAGVLVGVLFALYQQGILAKLPIFRGPVGPLPAYSQAFTENEIQQATNNMCTDLQSAIDRGTDSQTITNRVATATEAESNPALATDYITKNAWVTEVSAEKVWLAQFDGLTTNVLKSLQASTINKSIEYASLANLKAAYAVPLRTTWLTQCGLNVNFDNRLQKLQAYDLAKTKLRAAAVSIPKPSPSSSNVASGPTPSSSASASAPAVKPTPAPSTPAPSVPPTGNWVPSGYKAVDGFTNFAYSPVLDYCSSGTVCAKFKIMSKVSCGVSLQVEVQFTNAKGAVLETVNLSSATFARIAKLLEADPQNQSATDWHIAKISCS